MIIHSKKRVAKVKSVDDDEDLIEEDTSKKVVKSVKTSLKTKHITSTTLTSEENTQAQVLYSL